MKAMIRLEVREKRCPLWALTAPGLYLLACLLAVRSVFVDRADVGVFGLLIAAGLIPAFAIPAVFASRRAVIAINEDGMPMIDGRTHKIDDCRIERAERGSAVLHLVTRDGRTRTFIAPSYKEAQCLVAMLPPVSAPAGALAV